MNNVIDMITREAWRIEQHEPTQEERTAALVTICSDHIFMNAIKIRAASGLDLALRVLHQVADDLKNYGKQ